MKNRRWKYIYRSAVTGRIVTEAWALQHPERSVRERVYY